MAGLWSVSWAIDFDDEEVTSPEGAARKALDYLTREGSIAHVFDVVGPDRAEHVVDLDALDGVPDAPPVGHYDR